MAKKNNIAPEPWERQTGESVQAFEAFAKYRDMPDRTIRKVAFDLNKSVSLIAGWSSKWNWQERVAAWDTLQDEIVRKEQLKAITKMRKNHAELANQMLVKAAKGLIAMKPELMTPQDISRMVDVASKLERISRGDSGEIVENRDGGQAINPVKIYIPDNGRDGDDSDADEQE